MNVSLIKDICQWKIKRHAVILAHNYQLPEIQDVADFVGDSLELSIQATKTKAKVIVFCGVDFMAETAAILNPDKIVLYSDKQAQCPMAKMITPDKVRQLKKEHPGAKVVCYVNTLASIKAESDICCTSANAKEVVNSLEAKEIIFIPDQHLGDYVALGSEKRFILFPGFCPTHLKIKPQDVITLKEKHPEAVILAHPECIRPVRELAEQILGTGGMCRYVAQAQGKEFIIATENGLVYRLKKENPKKTFYEACHQAVCPNMKKITLEKVLQSLEKMEFKVEVPEKVAKKARRAIEKMIAV